MRYFQTSGLILRKQTSGENDYFLTIFSPEHGKIQAISKSARKSTSQTGNHLDVLNLCQFQLYKNNDRYLITECRSEKTFSHLKTNFQKSLFALTVTEIILKSLQTEENSQLFQLYLGTLESLESTHAPELILENFKIKLLKISGNWPQVSYCYFCQDKWNENSIIYCDQLGQITCHNCLPLNSNELHLIDFSTVKLANFLAEHQIQLDKLIISENNLFGLQKITAIFLQNFILGDIKSAQMLHNSY